MNWLHTDPAVGSTNCGRNASMKTWLFGLTRLAINPSLIAAPLDATAPSPFGWYTDPNSIRSPRQIRYAPPAYRIRSKASGLSVTSVVRPSANNGTCTAPAMKKPKAVNIAAFRPCDNPRPTIRKRSGPGVSASRTTAREKAKRVVGSIDIVAAKQIMLHMARRSHDGELQSRYWCRDSEGRLRHAPLPPGLVPDTR